MKIKEEQDFFFQKPFNLKKTFAGLRCVRVSLPLHNFVASSSRGSLKFIYFR